MPLTRLDNLISSKTGRYLYVSPDDFNASDELDNRGNSPNRPFVTIQRAFIEVARYSYAPGIDNDRFDEFTIMLMPGDHYIDNRPGLVSTSGTPVFGFDQYTNAWTDSSVVDLSNPDNVLYKFNGTEGGCIVPRGCSLIGYDLRRTHIRPLYVPDPADKEQGRTSIFNVTGGAYIWQFTIKDGDVTTKSPLFDTTDGVGKVYYRKNDNANLAIPEYSHHKITVFQYAEKPELELYYKKVAQSFAQYQPTIDDQNEFSGNVSETRIVGPLSDLRSIESLQVVDSTPQGEITVNVTTKIAHGYIKNQFFAVQNNGLDEALNGTFNVASIDPLNRRRFSFTLPGTVTSLNLQNNQTYSTANGLSTGAYVQAEVDSVESASPYMFNLSIRSTWGICGLLADGSKVTGFKSMVCAQYTGVSLQKDDRAFIRYDKYTNTWNQASLSDAFATVPYHTKGDAYWKDDWRNCHIKAINDAFIQCVSIFAVGFADHFLMESGGDMSITNSNSNFGNTSLHAVGHKGYAFAQDKGGYIDAIIPPKKIVESSANKERVDYYTFDVQASNTSSNNTKLYFGGTGVTDPLNRPAATLEGYRIGARSKEKIFVELDPYALGSGKTTPTASIYNGTLEPSGFKSYPSSLQILNPTTVVVDNKNQDAANRIEDNKDLIAQETYGYITTKYEELKNKNIIISKCQRDVGLILDAVISDLRLGGNINTIQAAESYFSAGELNYIDNERFETIEGFEYARDLAIAAARNWSFLQTGCSVTSGSSTVTVPSTVGLAIGMKVEEYSTVVGNTGVSGLVSSNIPSETYIRNILNSTTIELGSVVSGARSYLTEGTSRNATGTNSSANLLFKLEDNNGVRKGIWSTEVGTVDTTITQDTVYPACASVASAVTTLMDGIKTIINQGINPVGDRFSDAHDLLLANKNYIADIAVKDMLIEYPSHTVPGGNVNCFDDIVDIVEAVAYNVKFGKNNKVWDAANLYVTGAHLAGEEEQSIYAFRVAKVVSQKVIQNQTYTPRAGVTTAYTQTIDATITTDPNPVSGTFCADVISAMDTLYQLVEYGIDTAGANQQQLGQFTPSNAVYDAATGDLTLTMTSHGLSSSNKISIAQDALTFTCGMDANATNHTYPRVGDPAFKNSLLSITDLTADTVKVNVGATPIVGYNIADASYTASTGVLELTVGNHEIGQGDTVKLDNNALEFRCAQDNYGSVHSYPRPTDPKFNTSITVDTVGTTSHTITDAAYTPSTGALVATVAGHGFHARSQHTATNATFDPFTGKLVITINAHGFSNGDSIKIADNSLTFTCLKDNNATEHSYPRSTDPSSGKSLVISNVTTNTFEVNVGTSSDRSTHTFASSGTNGITRVGDRVWLEDNSLVFTCAKDNNATSHSYPRPTDDASKTWLEITAADTDTFTINIGISPDTTAHSFVSAVASGVKKQTGTIALNVGTSPAVTFTPSAATYDPVTGDMVLTIGTHSLVAETKFTPAAGTTYDPSTGIMSIRHVSHGLVVGDKVKIDNGAVSFTCLEDSNNTTHAYPRATDPVANKELEVLAVTNDTFDVQVLATVPSTNITAHTFVSSLPNSITKAGQSVTLAPNSLSFTCAMDGGTATKTYPRTSDPVYNTAIPIKAVGASTITLHVGPSPLVTHTPGAGTSYDPNTGNLVLAIGDHTLDVGDGIKIADDSLTFECDEDSRATQHTYPRSSDPASDTSVYITAVGSTDHTVSGAVYNTVTGIMTLTIVGHGFSNGNRIKLADNSLTFTCDLDGNTAAKTYPRPHDPASGAWLEISNVQTDTFDVQVLPALPSTNTSTHAFTGATANGLARQDGTVTVNVLTTVPSTNTTQHYFMGATADCVTTGGNYAHTFVTAAAGAVTTGGDYTHTFWNSKPFGLKTGGNYPHAFVNAATNGVTAFATNAGQFAATSKESPSQNVVIRNNPSTSTDQFAQRATLFTIDAGGINPHKFETGTPVRLIARAKAGATPDERDVRLPQGFQPNRTYYVIAPGRNTQPFNYNDPTVYNGIFDGGDQTKLMLAESVEAAAAGIYIYSPETESLADDVEILVQQFTLDTTYDLHEYKVYFSGTSSTILKTDVAHIFDKPTSALGAADLQKVFFRATGSDGNTGVLPTGAGSGASQILPTTEYYVRYESDDTFKIFETAQDAITGSPEVQLANNPSQFWYVLANKRTSPMRFDPTFVDTSASRVPSIPDGLWYLNLKDESSVDNNILSRLHETDYSSSSGRLQTTDSYYERTKDDRKADDRIYRLRYIQPKKFPGSIRKPNNGFVLKLRTDDKRNLIPQNITLAPVGGSPQTAVFRNPQSQNAVEELGMTKAAFDTAVQAGTLQDKYIYDPDNDPCVVNTDSYIRFSIRSARKVTVAGSEYLQVTAFDHRVDDTNAPSLKNTVFHTVKIDAPQGGAFSTSKIASSPSNLVQWSGGSSGFGYIHAYFALGSDHYIILKDVSARPTYDPLVSTKFEMGAVYATQQEDVNGGRDSKTNNLYVVGGSNVFTLTVGDTLSDSLGNQYKVITVEDVPQIDDTFYIFDSEEIQERVAGQQDGIYYLTAVRGNISPLPRGAGVGQNFQNFKFSQPISSLYPLDYKNDPTWYQVIDNDGTKNTQITDPPAANSFADNYTHGLVWVNDYKRSMTKEAVTDLTETAFFKDNTYEIKAQTGNATAGSEQRLIGIAGDAPSVHDQKVYIELRRPSIARSGNHTFEYLGFGPGNYSTGLPARQEVVLTPEEDFYAQSKKQDGGIVFYTGINSQGDLYIGNRRINAITGEETFIDAATLQDDGDKDDVIGSLVTTFDTPVTFNQNITVVGGEGTLPNTFESPLIVSVQDNDLTQERHAVIVRSNVSSVDPVTQLEQDESLSRTAFTPPTKGDIQISKNRVNAAIFGFNARGNGQEYMFQTHTGGTGSLPSNMTPNNSDLVGNPGGTRLASEQYTMYGNVLPRPGDVLLKGKEVGRTGSLGWIYANYYEPIADTSIFTIEFINSGSLVKLTFKSANTGLDITNDDLGITSGSQIRINDFYHNAGFNSIPFQVASPNGDAFSGTNNYVHFVAEGITLANETLNWNGDIIANVPGGQPNPTVEFSNSSFKEVGVLGSEALRTETDTIGDYKLGINTIARSAHSAYQKGFVSAETEPRANLDVVGTTFISGKTINSYLTETGTVKTETGSTSAFLVGGDSAAPTDSALFRVNTVDNRIGINVDNASLDSTFYVGGTSKFTDNAIFLQDVEVNGGGGANTADITTTITTGGFNLVNSAGFTGTLNIGQNATTIAIGDTTEADQFINIGRSSLHSNIRLGATPDNRASDGALTISLVDIGGAYDNNESLSATRIKTKVLKIDGDAELGSRRSGAGSIVKLSSTSQKVEFFSGNSSTSILDFATNASEIKIAGQGGSTTIRNNLIVDATARFNADVTLCGGFASYSFSAKRAQAGSTAFAHASGVLGNNLFNSNVDLVDVLRVTSNNTLIDSYNQVDTSGSGAWGGATFQQEIPNVGGVPVIEPQTLPALTGNQYYLPIKNKPEDAAGNQYFNENDILLIDTDDSGGTLHPEFVKIVSLPRISTAPYYIVVERLPFGTWTATRSDHPDTTPIYKCNVQYDATWITSAIDSGGVSEDVYLSQFGGDIDLGDYVIIDREDTTVPADGVDDQGELFKVETLLSQVAKSFYIKNGCDTAQEESVFSVDSTDGTLVTGGDANIGGSLNLTGTCTTPYIDADTNRKLKITNNQTVDIFKVDTCTGNTEVGNQHGTVFMLSEQFGSSPAAYSKDSDVVYVYRHNPQSTISGGPSTTTADNIVTATSNIEIQSNLTAFQKGDLVAIYVSGAGAAIEVIQITDDPYTGGGGELILPTATNAQYPSGGRGLEGTAAQAFSIGANVVKLDKYDRTTTLLHDVPATQGDRATALKARTPNTSDIRLEITLRDADLIAPKLDYITYVRIGTEWFIPDSVDGSNDISFAVKTPKQIRNPNTIGTPLVDLYGGGKLTVHDDVEIYSGNLRMYGSDGQTLVMSIANDDGHSGDGSLADAKTSTSGLTLHGGAQLGGDLKINYENCQAFGLCSDVTTFKVTNREGNVFLGEEYYQAGKVYETETASKTMFHIDNLGSAGVGGTEGAKDFRIYQNNAIDSFGIEKYWTGNGGRRHTYVAFDTATGVGQQIDNPLQVNNNYLVNASSGSNIVLYLPDNPQTGDMIRFVELSGNLTYNTSLIIRAKKISGIATAIQGDATGSKLDAGNGQSLATAWDSGELVIQTRNASFGLVFAGTVDIEGSANSRTIPPALRGWWLMEL